jgi:hypothetical protein
MCKRWRSFEPYLSEKEEAAFTVIGGALLVVAIVGIAFLF